MTRDETPGVRAFVTAMASFPDDYDVSDGMFSLTMGELRAAVAEADGAGRAVTAAEVAYATAHLPRLYGDEPAPTMTVDEQLAILITEHRRQSPAPAPRQGEPLPPPSVPPHDAAPSTPSPPDARARPDHGTAGAVLRVPADGLYWCEFANQSAAALWLRQGVTRGDAARIRRLDTETKTGWIYPTTQPAVPSGSAGVTRDADAAVAAIVAVVRRYPLTEDDTQQLTAIVRDATAEARGALEEVSPETLATLQKCEHAAATRREGFTRADSRTLRRHIATLTATPSAAGDPAAALRRSRPGARRGAERLQPLVGTLARSDAAAVARYASAHAITTASVVRDALTQWLAHPPSAVPPARGDRRCVVVGRVTPAEEALVTEFCLVHQVTRSAVVRDAVARWVARHAARPDAGSAAATRPLPPTPPEASRGDDA